MKKTESIHAVMFDTFLKNGQPDAAQHHLRESGIKLSNRHIRALASYYTVALEKDFLRFSLSDNQKYLFRRLYFFISLGVPRTFVDQLLEHLKGYHTDNLPAPIQYYNDWERYVLCIFEAGSKKNLEKHLEERMFYWGGQQTFALRIIFGNSKHLREKLIKQLQSSAFESLGLLSSPHVIKELRRRLPSAIRSGFADDVKSILGMLKEEISKDDGELLIANSLKYKEKARYPIFATELIRPLTQKEIDDYLVSCLGKGKYGLYSFLRHGEHENFCKVAAMGASEKIIHVLVFLLLRNFFKRDLINNENCKKNYLPALQLTLTHGTEKTKSFAIKHMMSQGALAISMHWYSSFFFKQMPLTFIDNFILDYASKGWYEEMLTGAAIRRAPLSKKELEILAIALMNKK